MSKTKILYEDNDLLVCHKPAGIATQTARIGQADMASEMENYLARNLPQSIGCAGSARPHIHVVHRLDQPVEGILVFAKNSPAAAVLSAQAASDGMEKEYLAIVCDLRGKKTADGTQGGGSAAEREQEGQEGRSGVLTDHLLKDGQTNMSRVVPPEVKGAKEARLHYEILREESERRCAVVRIRLYTGRHHQIRVQMANAGMPLLGDRKYADQAAASLSEDLGIREIALCAYRLSFCHPKTGERLHFEIMPEGAAFQGIRF